MKLIQQRTENPIRGEIYSVERLEEYAIFLAAELKTSEQLRKVQPLLPRMKANGKILLACYRSLSQAIHKKETITPAGEWLTDNFHIIEDQLRQITNDLPPSYYQELPKLSQGELLGYPRIYAIALALIAHTDSELEPEKIRRFIQAYQKVTPLTIGELWALAITLRLALVENLRRLAVHEIADSEKRNIANQFVDELFASIGESEKFQKHLNKLPTHCKNSLAEDCTYISQITKRLKDQEPEIWPALEYVEKYLRSKESTTDEIIYLSHQRQAANQLTVANIITSMRLVSTLNWRDFFESLSPIDRILEKDPFYKKMDFLTRDHYRHIIERVSKKTRHQEVEVAEKVIALTENSSHPASEKTSHIGYYLIGAGFDKLKKAFNYHSFSLAETVKTAPHFFYFSLVAIFFLAASALPIYYTATSDLSLGLRILISLVILTPCSDLALSLTNIVLTHIVPPENLPKLDLSTGIPKEARTLVIMPSMLSGLPVIQELLEKIEIHYLGNNDNNLYFALVTDFTDASEQSQPSDQELLRTALDGIAALNQKYSFPEDRFFLFHRHRLWNPQENTWMGWERKRGKIHELNRLLRGDTTTSYSHVTAPAALLPTFRYVITLDADTQLPRDTARKLIGTILHPLNHPVYSKEIGRVVDGYGVLQPRIGISLESANKSYFSKIFSGYIGIDPYTTAVSEVYQDLFKEGTYTGKGLYDIDAFEAALHNRAPENAILSHDLFEGAFARTALLTDIELLDDYPQSYRTFFLRNHRWTRGDWQLIPWLFPFVPNAKKEWVRNVFPFITRWKILENLRRSLVAPTTFLWLILGWSVLPHSPVPWTLYITALIVLPFLAQIAIGTMILHFSQSTSHIIGSGVRTKINLTQITLYLLLLAHQAYVHTDAIVRTCFRKFVSKKYLLQWVTADHTERQGAKTHKPFWQTPWPVQLTLAAVAVAVAANFFENPQHLPLPAFFILLWFLHPWVAKIISQEVTGKIKPLDNQQKIFLRQIGRRTWHYFETFVTAEENWLPPDNHQISPSPVTARRTSPTNIGLYILALVSARDMAYIFTTQFIQRLSNTLETLKKLEQYKGHYLNWYDTHSLHPLHPKYISTVDSGNLAGYLVTARQYCLRSIEQPVILSNFKDGFFDVLQIIEKEFSRLNVVCSPLSAELTSADKLLSMVKKSDFLSCYEFSEKMTTVFEHCRSALEKLQKESNKNISSVLSWASNGIMQAQDLTAQLITVAPWIADPSLHWLNSSINTNMTLTEITAAYEKLSPQLSGVDLRAVYHQQQQLQHLADSLEEIFGHMDFSFLVDKDREIFTIGYNISDGKFDRGLYDLLGSESRLASFVAVAKGDVKQEHWFRLGRQLVPTSQGRALVSWTASMFEYLMPLLVQRNYENTLLYETVHTVVNKQIEYGKRFQVPWGISESGYNARDLQFNYQYGPFGVPGLGLKRGLSHDLVISPYSTILAAMVNPHSALENLKRLADTNLLTTYGYFEAVDYTPERVPEKQKFAVIRSFMAHHQGMSLVAINNVLHDNCVQDYFHRDLRMQTTRLLLQEKVPLNVALVPPKAAEVEIETQKQPLHSLVRHYTDVNHSSPHLQLLSNRNYSVMITTAGSGYSKYKNLAVSRWREDVTRDNHGQFIFIKDLSDGNLFSTTYQPFAITPESYKVTFREEKADFQRRDGDISTHTQILVAPEDNVEIRHLSITNHSNAERILELTSYLEPVLSPAANDLDHMAFSKLFLQTEFLPSKAALFAKRRKRSAHDDEHWGLHVVVTDAETRGDIQYETDRSKFIGRGRNLVNSSALSGQQLSNTFGTAIDPIFSLRIQIVVPADSTVQVAFTTGVAPTRDKALELADRYHDIRAFEREAKFAWTQSQADLTHLNIDSSTAHLYQRVAERVLYSESSLRPPTHHRVQNTFTQSNLWPSGISGDFPIVTVRIKEHKDLTNVRKLLRCHEYLRLKGLVYDFVIISEHEAGYFQDLLLDIQHLVRTSGNHDWLNKNGGIFVLSRSTTTERDLIYINAIARVSLVAGEPLKEQILRYSVDAKHPPQMSFTPSHKKELTSSIEKKYQSDLLFYNGFGGFTPNGSEYVITLNANQWTPAPWINVISNRLGFGFQISESGSGYTWSMNSQTNRLTPWSNDPVSDPSGEILYLRDDTTGEVWTPTPLPIRTETTYTIRHGQGYTVFESTQFGIQQTLTQFVPKSETVKISLLKLKNLSPQTRKISLFSYAEWVLGTRREKTAAYVICETDAETNIIFARNPYDNEFANKISFADISLHQRTFTCSRKEFLGRHGNYTEPAALKRSGLSHKKITALDPCAAFHSAIELKPHEEIEVSVLLGQCEDKEAARALSLRYRNPEQVKKALHEVIQEWENILKTIQVKTPEPSMDLLVNRWLLYQSLSCRYWARTAFYQSGGAYGFRDQLQDCLGFVYAKPQIAREHILKACSRQFKEGDVQHWWHPPTGRGVRTRITDDLLWLPYVVCFYIQTTGDYSLLQEQVAFLEAPLLKPGEEDSFTLPEVSTESATVFEHCLRAIDHSLSLGQHELPLIGSGDWNDGMNRVGIHGQGESVWLGWFLHKVIADFLPLCNSPELQSKKEIYKAHLLKLKSALEGQGWDGDWYRRAFYDDGSALGSAQNEECRIDSISQSWSVLSKAGDVARAERAMAKVYEQLINKKSKLILLLTPPFDKSEKDPGYIKGYIPGVRENGGQYTHAAIWVIMAFAELGKGETALELFNLINPILHTRNQSDLFDYKTEPYAVAADVYGGSHEGRGGWSWYTGSASWYYRAAIESILGLKLRGNKLQLCPCIPQSWKSYELTYTYGKTPYQIEVRNPSGLSAGFAIFEIEGRLEQNEIELIDDGVTHKITATLKARQSDTTKILDHF